MTTIAAIILIIIFTFLSGLHVYWAFGGRWASDGVFPTTDEQTELPMPGVIPTLIVAFGLLFFAFIVLIQISPLRLPYFHEIINKYELEPMTVFTMLYKKLIGLEKGPKLAGFIRTIGRERVLKLLVS